MVLLLEETDGLRVLVDPNWRKAVAPADFEFLEELITDFAQRANSDPANLFEQSRMLNLGPLVTEEEGPLEMNHPKLLDALRRFVAV